MQKKSSRVCFIFNPSADRHRAIQHIDWLEREASRRWHKSEIVITQKGQNVADLARSKSADFDLIVACGGDGTINNVVNGIAGTGATLGVLPIGSGNDFVKTLDLRRPLQECMEILYLQHEKKIDLIKIEGDVDGWCANTLGIGLDGLANYYAGRYKLLKGHIVYVLGVIKAAFAFSGTTYHFKTNKGEFTKELAMITACNGKWEGGSFHVAPEAEMDDGLIDLLTIDKLPLSVILAYLPQFLNGPSPLLKGVHTTRHSAIEIQSEDGVAVHSDGEFLGSSITHLKLTVKEKILPVAVPYS